MLQNYTNQFMNDYISILKNDFLKIANDLISSQIIDKNINLQNISIDFNSKSKQGDVSSNFFIFSRKYLFDKNYKLDKKIEEELLKLIYIDNFSIGKSGFINIFFKKEFIIKKINEILKFNEDYGKNNSGENKKINIEFISANPTGPLHIAHIRGAVFGDVLANILNSSGYKVTREYYVNDAGSQINILGESLFKRYQNLNGIDTKILENEYPGEYLIDFAKEIFLKDKDKWINEERQKTNDYFKKYAINKIINNIKDDLKKIDINFDIFTFESDIVKKNYIQDVFKILEQKELLYEGYLEQPKGDDNKNWKPRKQLLFSSSKIYDDVDRPFKKDNGEWTYFANDAAYHYDKIKRNFDKLINIWGSDHFGYINRMKSIVSAMSDKSDILDVNVCQLVRLLKNGAALKMSKRDGNFITLKEIFESVGKDSIRYYMISSKNETPMDFDLSKVVEKNKDNHVFYCQYAYARATSVISKAEKINFKVSFDSFDKLNFNTFSSYEYDIILKLISWPYVLKQSSIFQQPHRITNYIEDLCSHFHSFWNKGKDDQSLRFIDEVDTEKTISKLIWIECFRIVLRNSFKIIGIDTLEKM